MEDWMPDEHDIDILLNIDHEITSRHDPTVHDAPIGKASVASSTTLSPQKRGLPPEDVASGDDSSDGEENLELALEQSQHDADVVKRLRHRLISCRSRLKKKRELVDLARTVHTLERQYHALQSSFPSLGHTELILARYQHHPSSDPALVKQIAYRRLLQQADQLRSENITLQHAIAKHKTFASSVQASISSTEAWTLEHIHAMTVCDFVSFRPLTTDQFQAKLCHMLQDMASFNVPNDAAMTAHANVVDGWTDRRQVIGSRVNMVATKSFPANVADSVMERTWAMLTSASLLKQVLPFLRKLDVLQTLTGPQDRHQQAVVVRRDFVFAHDDPTKRRRRHVVHYTTLLLVWQKLEGGGHVLTSRTIDVPVTDHAFGVGETWVNECFQYTVHLCPILYFR
ncbi:hypothetical protein H257_05603 [Aphanomyces astaci]|uniref:BZIP domain-containing protein n=1 Tax=Aphanomyces astaci TaxID=112090 RepID=W4GTA0_APHAT|nr:hypothetical protein H257_05603 [Aphanomyces astaci]ETV82093.1 hypothetical protein H257_05603 [Aphanomyces astaci]|eukprot:XP_009828830.1 hypothetical protein H257_05603 [Aphanomyces astaci]